MKQGGHSPGCLVKAQFGAMSTEFATVCESGDVVGKGVTPAANAATIIRGPLVTLLATHVVNDFYTAILPAILGVLEARCQLSSQQAAWVLGIGSVVSGLSQPLFGWLGEHGKARGLGSLGMILTAIGISSLGSASSFTGLIAVY
ncbi:MAG TPA: hypothetical protein VIY86_07610, partial [Pirellulaceae bacterium]